ncbi:hypothetical protein BOW53_07095 [Solemya pervernicosa gill symbiont]|uniref:DUF6817 domain-containing protein n=2 Tax=Gammaproteobacteria incertae sedis TaxID=118884 RepID=A0A1T2L6A2_9GAMM|nr:HD domain-containing protein [Candidatus Reidiella endopervernicosa]OOZ40611.1 hypothetical protein BOW53_07095 [Solemya pervernicosa gill symbiont]QKQ26632.1 HD domain-containing protein [Candidatus Reidiella endopervernicosa]
MYKYAQTNIQLYSQLRALNFDINAVELIFKAYELSLELFPSHFRANGRPFLCHLVGTASIMAEHKFRVELVAAALLHSVYLFGQFGDPRPGVTERKRKQVIAAVGEEVESLVMVYTEFPWSRSATGEYAIQFGQMSDRDREILIMRLANELEENLEFEMAYSRKDHLALYEGREDQLRSLALALVNDEFAVELNAVINPTQTSTVSERLKRTDRCLFSAVPTPWLHRVVAYLYKKRRKLNKLLFRFK